MGTPEDNNKWTRNFYSWDALLGKGKIMPEIFNNELCSDNYPGIQRASRNIIHSKHGAFILQDSGTDDFRVSGSAGGVDVGDGYILTKDSSGRSRVVYANAVNNLQLSSTLECVAVNNAGVTRVIDKVSCGANDVPIAIMSGSGGLVDVRNIESGINRVTVSFDDVTVADSISVHDATVANDISVTNNASIGKKLNTTYYCSSLSEINAALTSIGSANGTIIIDASFSVTSTIDIDGGGDYIIMGGGDNTELDMADGVEVFEITDCSSCRISDIKIDASAASDSTPVIKVVDSTSKKVVLERIDIDGGTSYNSQGIRFENSSSDPSGCVVRDCKIHGVFNAVRINEGNYITIDNCEVYDIQGNDFKCIDVRDQRNKVVNCSIHGINDTSYAGNPACIYAASPYGVVANNIIYDIFAECGSGVRLTCIHVDGLHMTVSGNVIRDIEGSDVGQMYGIWVDAGFSSVNGNMITKLDNDDEGTSSVYGIVIWGEMSSVSGNTINELYGGGVSGNAYGITCTGDDNSICGNAVTAMSAFSSLGCKITGDDCSVTGNVFTEGLDDIGTGTQTAGNVTP